MDTSAHCVLMSRLSITLVHLILRSTIFRETISSTAISYFYIAILLYLVESIRVFFFATFHFHSIEFSYSYETMHT